MSVRLPRLQSSTVLTDEQRRPSSVFQRYFQALVETVERALNLIADLTGITDQLDQALQQAQQATAAAQQAASDAQAAAESANANAAANAKEQALVNSYINPSSVLTANPTTVFIASHTRIYGDGTSVSVAGGSVPAGAGATFTSYVSYSDPTRAGGTVAYVASTQIPTQGHDVHVVGAITIPSAGTATGGSGPRRPGEVEP